MKDFHELLADLVTDFGPATEKTNGSAGDGLDTNGKKAGTGLADE